VRRPESFACSPLSYSYYLFISKYLIFFYFIFLIYFSLHVYCCWSRVVLCAAAKRKRERGGRASLFFSCLPERLADCCRSAFATIIVHQRARAVGVCRIISSTILFIGFALYYIYIYIISKEAGGKSRENNESEIFASASLPALPHRQASKGALRGLQEESEA